MLFADGENLLLRYEAMKKHGAEQRPDIIYHPGRFVWSPSITMLYVLEYTRVAYYTTLVGDDKRSS